MKKILTVILVIVCYQVQAQVQEDGIVENQNKHEFRIDAVEALAVPTIEINYEYVISKYSGAGIALGVNFDDVADTRFTIEPFYRQYFLNKKDYGARGFFVEGLLRFAGGENLIVNTTRREDWTDLGIGVVLGQKWVSDNGFVFEISLGAGRYLLNENSNKGFVRGGILVGYRFF